MARFWSFVCGAAVIGMTSATALGQGGDASRAADLFNEGRAALDKGEYAKACAKFEQSLALVPRPSTQINLAQCHEKQGHLVLAYDLYKQGLERLASDDPKLKVTMDLLDALTKRLPRLSIKVPADLPSAASIQLDGKSVDASPMQGIPVDPGQHTLLLTAPGRADVRTTVTLVEGQQLEITLNLGAPTEEGAETGPGATALPPTAPTDAPPVPTSAPEQPSEPAAEEGSALTTAGYVSLAIGGAGFVAAIITGAMVMSRDSDIEAECPNQQCTPEGRDLIDGAEGLIIGNYITWAVGIAGVGVGAVLLGIGLSSEGDAGDAAAARTHVVPLVGPGFGGISVQRSF